MGTWDRLHKPGDLLKQLAAISDPEQRERTRREWGLLGLDKQGRPGYMPISGSGLQSAINRGIVGDCPESFFGADTEGLRGFRARRAEVDRQRLYLNVGHVGRMYDSVEYLNLDCGLLLNTHITIVYPLLGVADQGAAAVLLSDFHREAGAWFRRLKYRYYFIYVHENARDMGFHTHLLTHLPHWHQREFKIWAKALFQRRNTREVPKTAVWIQTKNLRDPDQRVDWQWARFKYLCKTLDPQIEALGEDGRYYPLWHLLQIPPSDLRPGNQVHCAQRCGFSHEIGRAAQQQANGVAPVGLSAFQRRAWSQLYAAYVPPSPVGERIRPTSWARLYADGACAPRKEMRALLRTIGEDPGTRK